MSWGGLRMYFAGAQNAWKMVRGVQPMTCSVWKNLTNGLTRVGTVKLRVASARSPQAVVGNSEFHDSISQSVKSLHLKSFVVWIFVQLVILQSNFHYSSLSSCLSRWRCEIATKTGARQCKVNSCAAWNLLFHIRVKNPGVRFRNP